MPPRLLGRDLEATDRRNPSANRGQTETAARIDYEYERNGTANIFMLFAPLEGWRHVEVTDRHTRGYAHLLKEVSDTADARVKLKRLYPSIERLGGTSRGWGPLIELPYGHLMRHPGNARVCAASNCSLNLWNAGRPAGQMRRCPLQ
jgi:hypothetical protein